MENQWGIEKVFEISACGKLFNECQECFERAISKKQVEVCRGMYKRYQFCMASSESDRMNQENAWESFKEKWGHYPNDEKINKS